MALRALDGATPTCCCAKPAVIGTSTPRTTPPQSSTTASDPPPPDPCPGCRPYPPPSPPADGGTTSTNAPSWSLTSPAKFVPARTTAGRGRNSSVANTPSCAATSPSGAPATPSPRPSPAPPAHRFSEHGRTHQHDLDHRVRAATQDAPGEVNWSTCLPPEVLADARRGTLGDRLDLLHRTGADVPGLLGQALQSGPLPTEVPADALGWAHHPPPPATRRHRTRATSPTTADTSASDPYGQSPDALPTDLRPRSRTTSRTGAVTSSHRTPSTMDQHNATRYAGRRDQVVSRCHDRAALVSTAYEGYRSADRTGRSPKAGDVGRC
ncbi:hypothetical protein BH18ACT9_BH18ACT9_17930 [soil metagenome]